MLQSLLGLFSRLMSGLRSLRNTPATPDTPPSSQESLLVSSGSLVYTIPWGQKVSQQFRDRVVWICLELGIPVEYLMAVIAFESAGSFRPDVKNLAGSGATGLIQFMPATARGLGTTTAALALMTAEDQLMYVYRYFLPYKGRLRTLSDVYMAVLWPRGIGQREDFVLWDKADAPITYRQNAGLDDNRDSVILKGEAAHKIQEMLNRGRQAQLVWTGEVNPGGTHG